MVERSTEDPRKSQIRVENGQIEACIASYGLEQVWTKARAVQNPQTTAAPQGRPRGPSHAHKMVLKHRLVVEGATTL